MKSLIGAAVGALCLAAPALAETPAAIVEDVQGKVDGIAFMDYVAPGKIIKLGPKASITLSYLKSCQRETISEGVVLVGAEQSTVQLGEVKREKVPCDTNAAKLSEREANQSAATTFRTMRSDSKGALTKLPTLYGVAPLVQAKSGSTLVIERTDGKEPDQRAAQERCHDRRQVLRLCQGREVADPGRQLSRHSRRQALCLPGRCQRHIVTDADRRPPVAARIGSLATGRCGGSASGTSLRRS